MFRSPRDVGSLPVPKVSNKGYYDRTEIELYGCDICTDGGWTSETEVEIHKTKVHYKRSFMNELKKRDDYCYICIKKCANKESVIKHIKTEHLLSTENCLRVEREIFICEQCSAVFFNKENLVIHLRYAHLDMKNIELIRCVICFKNIQVHNMPAHFYMHNIQSVSTCRICLCKCQNTKALKEHISRTHPLYLKCDMCYYETSKAESFRNHILLRHKNSVKEENLMTGDNKLTTVDNKNSMTDSGVYDQNLISGDVKSDSDVDNTLVEMDIMTVIEISDMDPLSDKVVTVKNLMNDDKKSNKGKSKGIKKKKRRTGRKGDTAVEIFAKSDTNNKKKALTDNTVGDEDLITMKDLMTDKIRDDLMVDDVSDTEVTNIAATSKNLTADDVIKKELPDQSDLMIDRVMSDGNLMTVIEMDDRDLMTANVVVDTNSTDTANVGTNLTDNVITVNKDLMTDDVTKTSAEADTSLTVKPIKDLMTNNNETEGFKRYFIPDSPAFMRLQRIAGVRGIRLSNDVHICVLCREICVGLEEMRSHINEHAVKKEKQNSYKCSCGENFTNKVLLKHHAFKTKHVMN